MQRVLYCSLSAFIAGVIFILAFQKKISIFYAIFQLIFYSINFYFNRGSDLFKHGYYNTFSFIMINILMLLIFYILYFFSYLFRKKKYFIASFLILSFFSFVLYLIIRSYLDCEEWGRGLSGTKIQTKEEAKKNGDACYIYHPKRCFKKMLTGRFIKTNKCKL